MKKDHDGYTLNVDTPPQAAAAREWTLCVHQGYFHGLYAAGNCDAIPGAAPNHVRVIPAAEAEAEWVRLEDEIGRCRMDLRGALDRAEKAEAKLAEADRDLHNWRLASEENKRIAQGALDTLSRVEALAEEAHLAIHGPCQGKQGCREKQLFGPARDAVLPILIQIKQALATPAKEETP